jgi:hypothetical protein
MFAERLLIDAERHNNRLNGESITQASKRHQRGDIGRIALNESLVCSQIRTA